MGCHSKSLTTTPTPPVSKPLMPTHQGLDDEDALAAGYKTYRQRFDLVAEVMEAWWNFKYSGRFRPANSHFSPWLCRRCRRGNVRCVVGNE
jgi:hypothetical protein